MFILASLVSLLSFVGLSSSLATSSSSPPPLYWRSLERLTVLKPNTTFASPNAVSGNLTALGGQAGFSDSCTMWEGYYGSLNAVSGIATLAAQCYSMTGSSVFSTLDLNNCASYTASGGLNVGSGTGFLATCIPVNIPNSWEQAIDGGSTTQFQFLCPTSTPGVIQSYTVDLAAFVGNNYGVLGC